nr:AM-toxin synthetase [Alternaria alternata]
MELNDDPTGKIISGVNDISLPSLSAKQVAQSLSEQLSTSALPAIQSFSFPPLPNGLSETFHDKKMDLSYAFPRKLMSALEVSSMFCAAWAIAVDRYTTNDDVVFGAFLQDIPNPGLVPLRLKTRSETDVGGLLHYVISEITQSCNYPYLGKEKSSELSTERQDSHEVGAMLVFGKSGAGESNVLYEKPITCALTITCTLAGDQLHIGASYDSRVIEAPMLTRVLRQFGYLATQLADANPTRRLTDIAQELNRQDLEDIWKTNMEIPTESGALIQEIFAGQAKQRPHAIAVEAWDGVLSYGQLESLSTGLAHALLQLGIKDHSLIPFCLKNSKWAVVAMLGILKANCTFVPIDSSSPWDRRNRILELTHAEVIITSSFMSDDNLWNTSVLCLTEETVSGFPVLSNLPGRISGPGSAAYVLFTSGSTGDPKGVVVAHSAICNSLHAIGSKIGLDETSRTLQFTSLAFDISIFEILGTLIFGGTICVPSEDDRLTRLPEYIVSAQVNTASLTPSVARLYDAAMVPCLNTLILGGEAMTRADIKNWCRLPNLFNGFGPTETAIGCAMHRVHAEQKQHSLIGRLAGIPVWVVDPSDHEVLVPFGAVGELVVEGTTLALGYLDDDIKTQAAFIQDPPWLLRGCGVELPGRRGRIYKTGDLVQYNEEGSLLYVGRKDSDTQVKIRGNRVDLGEIESHLHECLPSRSEVVVDVVLPSDAPTSSDHILAVFLRYEGVNTLQDSTERTIPTKLIQVPEGIQKHLYSKLPAYMVPTVYFSVAVIPKMISGKTDRKRLRGMASLFSMQELAANSSHQTVKRAPDSVIARQLQGIWAQVLHVDPLAIGMDDSFFALGGDSIAAIRLVREARQTFSIGLTVADIFSFPSLGALAAIAKVIPLIDPGPSPAFTSLRGVSSITLLKDVAESCGLKQPSLIEDVYACTPLQEGLLALSSKHSGTYTVQRVLELAPDVDIARFQAAWETTARCTPIMRTRIVQHVELGLLQAVVDEDIEWKTLPSEQLDSFLLADQKTSMALGQPLMRYALTQGPYSGTHGSRHLVWTVHHALYDGWSLPLLLERVRQAYYGEQPQLSEFAPFIRWCEQDVDEDSAARHWQTYLEEADESALFPPLPPSITEPIEDQQAENRWALPEHGTTAVTRSIVLRAAWAIVASRYTSSNDVLFGTTVSGRGAPVPGIEEMVGPTVATVPTRCKIDDNKSASSFLLEVQQAAVEAIPFEQTGLKRISEIDTRLRRVREIQTFLVVQPAEYGEAAFEGLGKWVNGPGYYRLDVSALTLECVLTESGVRCVAYFDSHVIQAATVTRALAQFAHVSQQLCTASPNTTLGQIDVLTSSDLRDIWNWNGPLLQLAEEPLPHVDIGKQARTRPGAIAVHSWDAQLTYQELDKYSSLLAKQLLDADVKGGDIVPLYFEPSAWVVVAMLAVLKSGAAFTPIDTSQPEQRRNRIVSQLQPSIGLVSARHATTVFGPGWATLEVSRRALSSMPEGPLGQVDASSIAWVIFTSGSTGLPKGAMLQHSAVHTSHRALGATFGLCANTRMLQFSSFAFDACVLEIVATLMHGGCVCIPSELQQRSLSELPSVCAAMEVNTMVLTPTVARLFGPSDFPDLTTLVLTGEPLVQSDVTKWSSIAYVANGYGPAECSNICTVHRIAPDDTDPNRIGSLRGVPNWVVHSRNHHQLTPIGGVGELLIEGATVGHGYLNDAEKTAAAFVTDPAWLTEISHALPCFERHGRLYKTGDIVKLHEDGSLSYLGRKDTQIKIHGQRIELGEIEHHVLHCTKAVEVTVDAVYVPGEEKNKSLVAFVRPSNGTSTPQFYDNPDAIINELANSLPAYMIPTMYIQVPSIPRTASGKTDRKQLREMGTAMASSHAARHWKHQNRPPVTDMEKHVQKLWARVLTLENAGEISLDDSFIRLGGDSIAAMKLVSLAAKAGLGLTVAQIFRHTKLEDQARHVTLLTQGGPAPIAQFSLLPDSPDVKALQADIARAYAIEASSIEDVYPCTPLQEGLLSLSSKPSEYNTYTLQHVFELPPTVDIQQLRSAWEETIRTTDILRTRIVLHPRYGLVQVVVKEEIQWHEPANADVYIETDKQVQMVLGSSLVRYAISPDTGSASRKFIWTIHHALADGWTLDLILRKVKLAYSTLHTVSPVSEFRSFVKYITTRNTDEMVEYWKSTLGGYHSTTFPVCIVSTVAIEDSEVGQKHELPRNITLSAHPLSTLLRAAWAIVQSNYSNTSDVVFGEVFSGRSASVPFIEAIVGPTMATLPVRVKIDDSELAREMLDRLLTTTTQMIPHEQLGLQRISQINTDCQAACSFQTLLVIQPPASTHNGQEEPSLSFSGSPDYRLATYALGIECTPASDGYSFSCRARFDSRVLSAQVAERMMAQLGHVVSQLVAVTASPSSSTLVSDIVLNTPQDLEKLWAWNEAVLELGEEQKHSMLLHQVFRKKALAAPQATAISSWDGECSYAQLEKLSDALAAMLTDLGIGIGLDQQLVPLCFERSMWVVVAMMAVLKTGAGIVPLDPAHPPSRHERILAKVGIGGCILVSPQYAQRQFGEGWTTMVVSEASAAAVPSIHAFDPPTVTHLAVCWILFTSGSTGEPKGIYLEHGAICASYKLLGKTLGIDKETRMLHFSAYAFDIATFEIIGTLMSGGCICIPSDAERLERLPQFCTTFAVNTAILTPSVARLYTPNDIPTLRSLCLAGEAPNKQDISTWQHRIPFLFNCYGPAEAACLAATNRIGPNDADRSATRIGRLRGVPLWITAPGNCRKLAPIGAVGELLIEGSTLARGYWIQLKPMLHLSRTQSGCCKAQLGSDPADVVDSTGPEIYKYDEDGGVVYEGRKDNQVKIRGQRTELGEIEYHLSQCFPTAAEVVVEVATSERDLASVTLVAFVKSRETRDSSEKVPAGIFALPSKLEHEINRRLPLYMIPAVFVSVPEIPKTATDKTDRQKLRELASVYATRAVDAPHHQPQRLPSTVMEETLRDLWLKVIPVRQTAIGLDSNFFRLGGDSIAALKLVGQAQQAGIELSSKDIFLNPKLVDLAACCTDRRCVKEGSRMVAKHATISRFSLLPINASISSIVDEVANACGIPPRLVEDVYPCTPMQEGLMSLSSRNPGTYVSQIAIELAPDVLVDLFKLAWQQTVSTMPILRSRIIQHPKLGFLQAVLKEDVTWNNSTDLDEYLETDSSTPMGFGSELSRHALVWDNSGKHIRFVWTVHHSIYDHVTLRLILDDVYDNYKGNERKDFQPYTSFVRSVISMKSSESEEFWRNACKDEGSSIFPQRSLSIRESCEDTTVEQSYQLCTTATGVTMANVLHAAWAVVSSWHVGNQSIVFGTVLSGRTAPVLGIENIAGPTIATAPFPVIIDPSETISNFSPAIQGQMAAVIPHAQLGLQRISRLSSACELACNFQTLFAVQEGRAMVGNSLGKLLDVNTFSMRTYALTLDCFLDTEGFHVKASFDSRVVDQWRMESILRQFGAVAQQLATKAEGGELVSSIETLNEQGWELLRRWNSHRTHKQWAVFPEDCEKPSPIGAIGELLIEGPDFPSKYLEDPGARKVRSPRWMDRNGHKTVLLTGILVAFDQNGNSIHIGQKRTTISFKGQRIDVSQIERHITSFLAGTEAVVEAIAIPSAENSQSVLAVFLHRPELADRGDNKSRPAICWSKDYGDIEKNLSVVFPDMVPTLYIDMEAMPRTSHGDIDRSQLQTLGSLFPAEKVAILRASRQKRPAVTAMQLAIRGLWASLLGAKEDTFHLDDDFFKSGGDSIGVIKLVGEARKRNIALAAADIFQYPKLESLAVRATENTLSQAEELEEPFSLITSYVDDADRIEDFLSSNILSRIPYAREALQDVLPCTSMQKQLFHAQGQIYRFVLDFGDAQIDAHRLEHAVHGLIDRHAILRTLFVPYQTDLLQVVVSPGKLKGRFVAETLGDGDEIEAAVERVVSADKADTNITGCPMPQFIFLSKRSKTEGFQSKLIIARFSHMQFDGYSVPFVIRDLATLYAATTSNTNTLDADEERTLIVASETLPPAPQFSSYIYAHYSTSSLERRKYWMRLLRASYMTPITVKCDTPERIYNHTRYENRTVELEAWYRIASSGQSSPDDILTMAWALTLSIASEESDIVFGRTVAGRRALFIPHGGADDIMGPCVNTIPVRVQLPSTTEQEEVDKSMTLRDLLAEIHKQTKETLPFESTGLDEIVEHYAPSIWKKKPRRWTSTVVWQDFAGMQAVQHTVHRRSGNHEPNGEEKYEKVGQEDGSVALGYMDPFAASSNVAFADLTCRVTCEIPLFDPADVAVIGRLVDGSPCFALGFAPERVPEPTIKRLADTLMAVVLCLAEHPETSVKHLLRAQRENWRSIRELPNV